MNSVLLMMYYLIHGRPDQLDLWYIMLGMLQQYHTLFNLSTIGPDCCHTIISTAVVYLGNALQTEVFAFVVL